MTKKDITPYENNAKLHPKSQIEALAKIVQYVGWRQPVVVNQKGVIVVGHGRYSTWKTFGPKYGLKELWVIDDTGKTIMGAPESTPMSEDQERIYRLADNKLNESDWDKKMVLVELKLIPTDLIDLTGFSSDLVIEPDDKDDNAPPIPEKARTKLGDVYELGVHRLICGDSTLPEAIDKLMDANKADMVFTDPPYNVNYSGRGDKTSNKIMNDKMSFTAFDEFLKEVFLRYSEFSKSGAAWYVFHSSSTQHQFQKAIENAGWSVKSQIIWNKPVASMGWGDYRWKHEPMFYCGKEKTKFYGDRTNTSILNMPSDDKKALEWLKKQRVLDTLGYNTVWTMKREPVTDYVHPTQKPVELITHAILNSSKEGDIVVDLFGGSGATMIACQKLERVCKTMELDPKYCDVIVQRYIDYTGDTDISLNGQKITW